MEEVQEDGWVNPKWGLCLRLFAQTSLSWVALNDWSCGNRTSHCSLCSLQQPLDWRSLNCLLSLLYLRAMTQHYWSLCGIVCSHVCVISLLQYFWPFFHLRRYRLSLSYLFTGSMSWYYYQQHHIRAFVEVQQLVAAHKQKELRRKTWMKRLGEERKRWRGMRDDGIRVAVQALEMFPWQT